MFRVTTSQTVASTLRELSRLGAASGRLQADLSSGVRIRRPSDDPRGAAVVLTQRAEVQRQSTRLTAVNEARTRLQDANSRLLDVQQIMVKARTLALQGRQSVDPGEREILANEADRLLDTLVDLANTRHEGEALFGGMDLNTTPYQPTDAGAAIRYAGHALPGGTLFGDGSMMSVTYAGSGVFDSGGRGATLVTSQTGAAAGIGTSSARGVRQLTVRHTLTTYAGTSGVQAGASSVAGDTILGPFGTHQLTINDVSGTGAFGTISLNGGPPVSYSSSDADLAIVGPDGELVSVDTTSITAGFAGTVSLTAQGAASIDGGATETAIDFSANQGLIDSRDGSIAYIDSQAVRRTGTDVVDFADTGDVFQTVARLRDELRNFDGQNPGEVSAALGRRLIDFDRLSDHLLGVVGDQAVSLEQLDRIQARAEDRQLLAEQALGLAEGTDYATAALELQQQQTAIQFSLASIVRVFDLSVLNYL